MTDTYDNSAKRFVDFLNKSNTGFEKGNQRKEAYIRISRDLLQGI